MTETYCPRCPSKEAEMTKTDTHLILRCKDCGFDMGVVRVTQEEYDSERYELNIIDTSELIGNVISSVF